MKMNSLVVLFSLFVFFKADETETELPVVPKPVSVQMKAGVFMFHEKVVMYVPKNDTRARYPAQHLSELFKKSCGYSFEIKEYETEPSPLPSSAVIFAFSNTVKQEEGYELRIDSERIVVYGKAAVGMFHAAITIRQLLPSSIEVLNGTTDVTLSLNCCVIKDYPQYPYRGLMLDTGRHFSTVQNVKDYIDLLALHKMSVFHFHLTEDQGWRIEIKKYPKLIEIGAWRRARAGNFVKLYGSDPDFGIINEGENLNEVSSSSHKKNEAPAGMYGGYYSQEEIKEIVQFAESRCIRIQPEIELPGHAVAAIASYPNLSCDGKQVSVITSWGIFTPVFCSKEETITFLEDVLTEVMDLFPYSPIIHVGGDECPTSNWRSCENCKARMVEQNITSVGHLHGFFMERMEKHVNKRGRRLIGWDEIYSGGKLNLSTAIMVWHSAGSAKRMIEAGHDVVLTPMSHCYFDFTESSLSKVYEFDPLQLVLGSSLSTASEEVKAHILGGQGNLWTERLPTQERRYYNTFPRLPALAEALWTNKDNKNYTSFLSRMNNYIVPRYKVMNVTYNPNNLNKK